jgi:hypothetical protein
VWQNPGDTAAGGAMQRWEYKLVVRGREFAPHDDSKFAPTQWNIDIAKTAEDLGNDGWELVTVTPRSDLLRSSGGDANSAPVEMAGFTSSELWVFKRPK